VISRIHQLVGAVRAIREYDGDDGLVLGKGAWPKAVVTVLLPTGRAIAG